MLRAFLERYRAERDAANLKVHLDSFDRYRGGIIDGWAVIETVLNHANFYAWRYTKKEVSSVVPLGLQRKLELFKRIHRKVAPLGPLREAAEEISRLLDASYGTRHWLAHGALKRELSTASSWVLAKDKFNGDGGIENIERTFTQDELIRILNELADLATKLTVYTYAMLDQIEKHPVRN